VYGRVETHFSKLWYKLPTANLPNISAFYSSRGEKLPVLADFNMNPAVYSSKPDRFLIALVLRLDGSVDLVTWDSQNPIDIWRK
jgi:hypothetical protein